MHSPIRFNYPAAIMRRPGAASVLLCLAAMLGACSPFAGYVADHVPHWAGGLPPDAPPRPGAPGYDDFIAHGQPQPATAPAPATDASAGPASGATTAGSVAAPNAAASAPQAKTPPAKGHTGKVQIGRLQTKPPASAGEETEAAAPAEPVATPTADDPSVVKGGLY
jgi:hypothetical protein